MAIKEKVLGQRFGRLVVTMETKPKLRGARQVAFRQVLTRCDCGVQKVIDLGELRKGNVRSCGCLQRELASKQMTRHGMNGTPEYIAWINIKSRCLVQKDRSYARYGGRGIKLHPAWVTDFVDFYNHVGPRPSSNHSIDRIDNDGNYEPGNVRWAVKKQQARNRRSNRTLTHDGRTQTVSAWAEEIGITRQGLRRRLEVQKMSIAQALTTPLKRDP